MKFSIPSTREGSGLKKTDAKETVIYDSSNINMIELLVLDT